ncbi:DUF6527 family protein [Alicyclobacillus sp. ALC3]|uniref:DUF6527 family protein n=1 Tax=Alicyclobacillus sp. ALC3 TaxID=2796143 RepID=UPI003FCD76DF
MRRSFVTHQFVDVIPANPDEGILYISIRYRTAVHQCPCGCGNKVVTPIKSARWHLCFDGDSVSLSPSVGSWQFPCRSHYWIRNNEIRWAEKWTQEEIEAGRERDSGALRAYYEGRTREQVDVPDQSVAERKKSGLLSRIWQWLARH